MRPEIETPARWRAQPGQNRTALLGKLIEGRLPAMTLDDKAETAFAACWTWAADVARHGVQRGFTDREILWRSIWPGVWALGYRFDLGALDREMITADAVAFALKRGAA
jgi:hypothetical protein